MISVARQFLKANSAVWCEQMADTTDFNDMSQYERVRLAEERECQALQALQAAVKMLDAVEAGGTGGIVDVKA